MVNEPTNDVHVTNEQVIQEAQELAPRRSERQRRPTISSDFVVYSLEHECELSIDEDLNLFFSYVIKFSPSYGVLLQNYDQQGHVLYIAISVRSSLAS